MAYPERIRKYEIKKDRKGNYIMGKNTNVKSIQKKMKVVII